MSERNRHAVVIGGSMAGLLSARVLSNHFEKVTILERDPVCNAPEARKGQPQVRQLHGLLAEGFRVMNHYFPDLEEALLEGGALVDDIAKTMRWYTYGGYRKAFEFGTKGALMSRPFLEWKIRERVMALSNVMMLDKCSVLGLESTDKTCVTGVRLQRRSPLPRARGSDWWQGFLSSISTQGEGVLKADLVVDCSGRGSMAGRWLEQLGYSKPKESTVKVDVAYASRLYARNPDEPGAKDWIFITPQAPQEKRMGGAFAIEGDRWIVSVAGWHGDHAAPNEADFTAFAKSLPAPDVFDVISSNKPLSDIVMHKIPSSLRRHFGKLTVFPAGFLVLGDALCSFNPVYGQGMSSAALQVEALDQLLRERRGQLSGIARPFFKRADKIIDTPWQLAVGEDFRFPETKGKKAPGTDLINRYVARVHRASHHDSVVCAAFLKVMNLMAPPASLLTPRMVLRVMRNQKQTTKDYRTTPAESQSAANL